MSDIKLPEGAPEEVVTNAILREVSLEPFGANGNLSLITLDNGMDHNRPNTFGAASLLSLKSAIESAQSSDSVAIAITGKPFIFAAGADLSGLAFLKDRSQALQIGKLPPALPEISQALGMTLTQSGFLLSFIQLAGMSLALAIGMSADTLSG